MTSAPSGGPSHISHALNAFGTTIFTRMSRLAAEHGAVNLAQGFPDFDGPDFLKAAAAESIARGDNQYARMIGVPALNQAIAARWKADTGRDVDPDQEVTVTSGCTEAIAAALLGLCNPGDKVVFFEPFYDSYRACAAMAGLQPLFVPLRPSPHGFTFDPARLSSVFAERPRAVLINTPHNPTGKMFSRQELDLISSLCRRYDCIAITDEVYERLTFDRACPHIHLAMLDGMAERTVSLSSLGKSFSVTGWKVGWAVAPAALSAGVRAAHQFLTFSTATPFQHAAALAMSPGGPGDAYLPTLVATLDESRRFLLDALTELGFQVHPPMGTYFIMAEWRRSGVADRLRRAGMSIDDDESFCEAMTRNAGVAAIPPNVFYESPDQSGGRELVRFAFCKKPETIQEAVRRLKRFCA